MKFLIDLKLDGYETEEEMREACETFIKYNLNFAASSIKILWSEGKGLMPVPYGEKVLVMPKNASSSENVL